MSEQADELRQRLEELQSAAQGVEKGQNETFGVLLGRLAAVNVSGARLALELDERLARLEAENSGHQ